MLNYGFKRDLNQYIHDHVRPNFPIQSLADVVAFNAAHMPTATKYDQDLAIFSDLFDISAGSSDTVRYLRDRAEDITRSRGAILAVLNGSDGMPGTADDYDALLFSAISSTKRAVDGEKSDSTDRQCRFSGADCGVDSVERSS